MVRKLVKSGNSVVSYKEEDYIGLGSSAVVYIGKTKSKVVSIKKLRTRKASKKIEELIFKFKLRIASKSRKDDLIKCNNFKISEYSAIWREIHLMNKVKHENIPVLFQFYKFKRHFFIVSELYLINTKTLFEYEGFCNEYQEELVLFLISPLFDAVKHIHSLRFAHLVIHEGNIMLSYCGALKLIDFDIARSFNELDSARRLNLNLEDEYRAPEFLTGVKLHPSVDCYSLGCFIIRLLKGKVFNRYTLTEKEDRFKATVRNQPKELKRFWELYTYIKHFGLDSNKSQISIDLHKVLKKIITPNYTTRLSSKEICETDIVKKYLQIWKFRLSSPEFSRIQQQWFKILDLKGINLESKRNDIKKLLKSTKCSPFA